MRQARTRHLQILAVLLLAAALLLFDKLATMGLSIHYRDSLPKSALWWDTRLGAFCLGPVLAGVLIDRFGVRRVVGLAMLGWCALSLMAATAGDAVGAFALIIPLSLLPGIIFVGSQVAIKRAWPARRATVAVALVVLAEFFFRRPNYDIYLRLFPITDGGWRGPLLLLATCGAFVTMVWLLAFRGDRAGSARPAAEPLPDLICATVGMLSRREIMIVIMLMCCNDVLYRLVAYRVFRDLYYEHLREGTGGVWPWAPFVVEPIVFLAAAAWSGRVLGQTRSLDGARRPFIAGGFLLVGLTGLIPALAAHGDDIAMACIVGAGLGLLTMVEILKVDLAPPGLEGGAIGLVLTATYAFVLFVFDPLERALYAIDHPVGTAVAASFVALVGAAGSYRLLRGIEPVDGREAMRGRLEATFE